MTAYYNEHDPQAAAWLRELITETPSSPRSPKSSSGRTLRRRNCEENRVLRVISLGAGVQSSAMFLMACHGELTPKPDAAIFADTQWEPKEVYRWLAELARIGATRGIPIIQASRGNLRRDMLDATVRGIQRQGQRAASMPLYTSTGDGREGMIRRQCTREYKVEVVEREVRRLLGLKPRQAAKPDSAQFWLGISADEAGRMRESRSRWYSNHYPLIFDCEPAMRRRDCMEWLTTHGYPVPRKSACLGCPYHSNAEWRAIKENPEEWANVIEFDEGIRNRGGHRGQLYLHRSCKPLAEVDLSTAEERGQLNWINECEGMCGV